MTDVLGRLATALADRYRIERELGAGGMAIVYLAHDIRHDRKVALKVLRAELSAILGAERFLKEIRTTANLQHPHILPLHDSGEADGVVYYVMPYVEGESLRDRLAREKQLPVDDAVRIGREVASALDYAHRHNVVHRDIKPENILLHDGQALVADFGIALAAARTEGSTRLTETGMSLGTPQYMAPEQAMGEREVTAKADIYALGCVVYEMLAGEPPFTGPTAQAIIARVMTEEPRSLTLQRRSVPPHVEAAVLAALEKLPADRFATAVQFAEALAGQGTTPTTSRAVTAARAVPARGRAALLIGGSAALLAAGAVIGRSLTSDRAPPPLLRLAVTIPEGQRLSPQPFGVIALSPDGMSLAYLVEYSAYTSRMYLRRLDEPVAREVPGTDAACCPGFSSDGRWLYFGTAAGGLHRIPVTGGSPSAVPAPQGSVGYVPVGDTIVVTTGSLAIVFIRPDGRHDTVPGTGGTDAMIAWDVLPDGRVLATAGFVGPLLAIARDGQRDTLVRGLVTAGYYVQGHLLWIEQSGAMSGARLDRSLRRLDGQPVLIDAAVRLVPGGLPAVAPSRSGMLALIPSQPSELVVVDRSGRATRLAEEPRRYHSPRVSPDGRRIAFDVTDAATRDVWLLERTDRSVTRLSFEPGGHDPMWSADGRLVIYAASAGANPGIYRRNSDGSGAGDSVLVTDLQTTAHSLGRPGEVLAVSIGTVQDIVSVPLFGANRTATPVLATPYAEAFPALSPDGRWLAYVSDESGRPEVYVRAFPGPGGGPRVIVSQNGGSEPVWARSGHELFYRAIIGSPVLAAATIQTSPTLRVTSRRALFAAADYETAAPHANYDVFPGDNSFVMIRQGRASQIVVMQNWVELVRRQAAAR